MNDRTRGAAAILATLLMGAAGHAQDVEKSRAPDHMTFSFTDGDDVVLFEVDGGDVVTLLNGEPMPEDRYSRKGNVIRCRDRHGRATAILSLHGSGGTLRTLARRPHRLRLGVTLNPPSQALADHLRIEANETLYIAEVLEGKAGAESGLRKHDVITHIEGTRPATKVRLSKVLGKKEPGDVLKLQVLRQGEKREVEIELKVETDWAAASPFFSRDWVGLTDLSRNFAMEFPSFDSGNVDVTPFLARVGSDSDGHFVPYLLDSSGQGPWHFTTQVRVPDLAFGGQREPEETEKDLGTQLSRLESRIESLEKLLEKAVEKLGKIK